jgi:hypothetical protein
MTETQWDEIKQRRPVPLGKGGMYGMGPMGGSMKGAMGGGKPGNPKIIIGDKS